MRILALALADESQRYARGYPPKGARLFLTPNVEICRLATLARPGDDFHHLDGRVELLGARGDEGLVLVHVDFHQESAARELTAQLAELKLRAVFFGRLATAWQDRAPAWAGHRIIGDATNVWPEIRADAEANCLKPVYNASRTPAYVVPSRTVAFNRELRHDWQAVHFVRGCSCVPRARGFCTEHLYYGSNILLRSPAEIVGEVISLPGKQIQLLDDDVASHPDYYCNIFRELWNYRREWVVNASDRLFDYPGLIRLLAKAGTRIVFLTDSFLLDQLEPGRTNGSSIKRLYRRVKTLQANKMLVGARALLHLDLEQSRDFSGVATLLRQIDLDFVELRCTTTDPDGRHRLTRIGHRPVASAKDPSYIKDRFHSMGTIVDRLARRPHRVGFYTTMLYLLPYSAAYRQNYLEGIPWP